MKFLVHRPLERQPTTIVSTVYNLALGHELGDDGVLELAIANALDLFYHIRQFVLELCSDSTICR